MNFLFVLLILELKLYFSTSNDIENCSIYTYSRDKCIMCDFAMVVSIDGQTCFPYIKDCKTQIETNCIECYDNYQLSKLKKKCFQKIDHCIEINEEIELCTKCEPSFVYIPHKNECISPIESCKTYSNEGDCETCIEPKKPTMNRKQCAPYIPSCLIYKDDTKCKKCEDNKYLSVNNGKCLAEGPECNILYQVFEINYCSKAIPNCQFHEFDGSCNICNKGFIKSYGSTACATPIEGCIAYNDDSTCYYCKTMWTLSADAKICLLIENCLNISKNDAICLKCNENFVLSKDETNCVTPIDNCHEYDRKNNCSKCNPNYQLVLELNACIEEKKHCVEILTEDKCNNCKLFNEFGKCKLCEENFSINTINKCVKSIKNCNNYDEIGRCSLCNEGKLLLEDNFTCVTPILNCEKYSTNGLCSKCNNSKILNSKKDVCVKIFNWLQETIPSINSISSKINFVIRNSNSNNSENIKQFIFVFNETENYNISFIEKKIFLINDEKILTFELDPIYITNQKENELFFSLNYSNIQNNKFYMNIFLNFKNILNENDNFNASIISFEKIKFENLNELENPIHDGENSTLISIILFIVFFVIFIICIIIFLVRRKRKLKKLNCSPSAVKNNSEIKERKRNLSQNFSPQKIKTSDIEKENYSPTTAGHLFEKNSEKTLNKDDLEFHYNKNEA